MAAPQSKRYSLVGTAFDYLLRFYLQRLNPKAKQRRWVAEAGLEKLGTGMTRKVVFDADAEKLSFPDEDTGRKVLKRARAAYERFMTSGTITDSLLRSVIGLAQLDVVYRAGFVDENLGIAYREDVRDLRKLISLVNSADFRSRRICLLNPDFGVGTRLIRGADADLFIDGMLIDIKTTKSLKLTRNDFNQLLGYLAMHEIWGMNDRKRRPRVSKLGIYFARHGLLQVFDVRDVVCNGRFPNFLQWFREMAEQPVNRIQHNRRTREA